MTATFDHIHVEQIVPSLTNPRKHFDQAKLAELAESIKATGAPKSNFIEPTVATLPAPSDTPTAHNPFPVTMRHRLEG